MDDYLEAPPKKRGIPRKQENELVASGDFVLKSNVKYDGKLYRKDSVCPARLLEYFKEKGFVREFNDVR